MCDEPNNQQSGLSKEDAPVLDYTHFVSYAIQYLIAYIGSHTVRVCKKRNLSDTTCMYLSTIYLNDFKKYI